MTKLQFEVSVIVPVYNSEKYLSDCIKSILNQTFDNFELILVNDGSSDSSLEICRKFAIEDSRVVVIDKHNEGVSEARNSGLKNARGRFICFVDSDDIVEPNYIKALVNTQSKFNSELTISGVNLYYKDDITEYKVEEAVFENTEFLNLFSFEDYLFLLRGPVCKLFLKDIIKSNNLTFNKAVHYGEDAIFVLQYCLYIKVVAFSNDVSYQYFRRSDGLVCSKPHRKDSIVELEAFNEVFVLWAKRFNTQIYDIPYFRETLYLLYSRFFSGLTEGYSFWEYVSSYRHIDANNYSKLYRTNNAKRRIYLTMLRYAPRLLGALYFIRTKIALND